MKIFLVLLVCIILESTFVSYPLTLMVLLLLSIFRRESFIVLAFVCGIILDLFSLRPVGVDSLFFLALLYLADRYRKKIHEGAFIYRFLFILVSYVIFSLVFYKTISVSGFFVTAAVLVLMLLGFEKIFPVRDKQRLAV